MPDFLSNTSSHKIYYLTHLTYKQFSPNFLFHSKTKIMKKVFLIALINLFCLTSKGQFAINNSTNCDITVTFTCVDASCNPTTTPVTIPVTANTTKPFSPGCGSFTMTVCWGVNTPCTYISCATVSNDGLCAPTSGSDLYPPCSPCGSAQVAWINPGPSGTQTLLIHN